VTMRHLGKNFIITTHCERRFKQRVLMEVFGMSEEEVGELTILNEAMTFIRECEWSLPHTAKRLAGVNKKGSYYLIHSEEKIVFPCLPNKDVYMIKTCFKLRKRKSRSLKGRLKGRRKIRRGKE